jgi:hypothetical protein
VLGSAGCAAAANQSHLCRSPKLTADQQELAIRNMTNSTQGLRTTLRAVQLTAEVGFWLVCLAGLYLSLLLANSDMQAFRYVGF